MTLRRTAPHAKPRWIATLVVVTLSLGLLASTALALTEADAPTFSWLNDQDGADDEPGQKDLNAHSSATDSDGFWVTFTWDVTGVSGKNTADGCSLFDTDSPYNGLVDYALCVTAGGNPLVFDSMTLYSCGDARDDRCTNPAVISIGSTQCFLGTEPDPFHSGQLDTQSICVVQLTDISSTVTPKLVNSCSYPSREPNSDPSDCVVRISITTGVGTEPSGTTTWTATLEDKATLSPVTATGTVTFRLYDNATCFDDGNPGGLIWTSSAVPIIETVGTTQGTASTVNSVPASETGSNTISSGTGVILEYYWTATYTPTSGSEFLPFTTACGEKTTITPASVTGISTTP